MVKSIVIICEESPFGKNSVIESIRLATGLLAIGDIDDVKVILMKDAIYFLNQNLNPEAINVDNFDNIIRLVELSGIEIFIHDHALKVAGLESTDLILKDNIKIVDINKISQLVLEADMSFRY